MGFYFAKRMGTLDFVMETDSQIAYNLIVDHGCVQWRYTYLVRKIIQELQDIRRIVLIFW